MIQKYRRPLNLIFLVVFLSVVLFINFFHTEEYIFAFNESPSPHTHSDPIKNPDNRDCPACHFLNSTYTTSQIHFFYLPPPPVSGELETDSICNYEYIFNIEPSMRSPPLT
jgi:hypothetical protein